MVCPEQRFPQMVFQVQGRSAITTGNSRRGVFLKADSKYTTIEDVDPDNWFHANDNRANRKMYEQCYYSDSYGYVISLIWFD